MKSYLHVLMIMLAVFVLSSCKATKKAAYTPAGNWEYLITGIPDGDQTGTMVLTKEGDGFVGKIMGDAGTVDLEDLKVENNVLSSSFSVQGFDVNLTGNFEGETFKGNVEVGGYEFPITATRKP